MPVKTHQQLREERRAARIMSGMGVKELGRPEGPSHTHPLPRKVYLVAHGMTALQEGEYESRLDTDAAYDPARRARGLGWILRIGSAVEVKEAWLDFEGVGNNCAEVSAMVGGLVRARAEGARRVLLRTDSRLASHLLTRVDRPQLRSVAAVATELYSILPSFEAVAVRWTPERELKEVDRLSKSLLKNASFRSPNLRAHMVARHAQRQSLPAPDVPEFRRWFEQLERFP
jgi:ribonuclease HI